MTPIQYQIDEIAQYLIDAGYEKSWNYRLARRIERKYRHNQMGDGAVLPIYVVVLGISRHYGGPEEGGWWYDWTDVEEVRRVWDWKTARKVIQQLKEDYPDPQYDRGSVLGGTDIEICLTTDVEEIDTWQSTERPYYE